MSKVMTVGEMLVKGKTRAEIIKELTDRGMTPKAASNLYYVALRDLAPDTDFVEGYREGVLQQNMDRLEKIINETIGGTYQEKNVALKAIDQLNKMFSAYGDGNKVTIAQKGKGDKEQVIEIVFDK